MSGIGVVDLFKTAGAHLPDGRIQIWAIDGKGQLWSRYQVEQNKNFWTDWDLNWHGGQKPNVAFDAVSVVPLEGEGSRLEVSALATTGQIWSCPQLKTGNGWSEWGIQSETTLRSAIGAATLRLGRQYFKADRSGGISVSYIWKKGKKEKNWYSNPPEKIPGSDAIGFKSLTAAPLSNGLLQIWAVNAASAYKDNPKDPRGVIYYSHLKADRQWVKLAPSSGAVAEMTAAPWPDGRVQLWGFDGWRTWNGWDKDKANPQWTPGWDIGEALPVSGVIAGSGLLFPDRLSVSPWPKSTATRPAFPQNVASRVAQSGGHGTAPPYSPNWLRGIDFGPVVGSHFNAMSLMLWLHTDVQQQKMLEIELGFRQQSSGNDQLSSVDLSVASTQALTVSTDSGRHLVKIPQKSGWALFAVTFEPGGAIEVYYGKKGAKRLEARSVALGSVPANPLWYYQISTSSNDPQNVNKCNCITQWALFDRVLGKSEITDFLKGKAPQNSLQWLPMNEGSGYKLWDHSGNDRHMLLAPDDTRWDWATDTVTLQVTEHAGGHIFPTELDVYTGDTVEWLFASTEGKQNVTAKKPPKGTQNHSGHDSAQAFFGNTLKVSGMELDGTVKASQGEHFRYLLTTGEGDKIDPKLKSRGRMSTNRRGGRG